MGTIPSLDDASMMLVDEMFDLVKTEPTSYAIDNTQQMYMPTLMDEHSVNLNIGGNQQLKEELHSSSDGDTGSDTPFDPNDFFNDMYKSEVSYSPFSSPSYRNTPSPSNSQSSGSDQSSDYTPVTGPHQPETTINLYGGQQQLSTIPEQQTQPAISMINPIAINAAANKINIIQGTLIPIKVSLSPPHNTFAAATSIVAQTLTKRIKIQPKPSQTANCAANTVIQKSNTKPKTIVLSVSDYKALMLKCKSQPTAKAADKITPLTLKTSSNVPIVATAAANKNSNTMLSASKVPAMTAKVMPVDLQPIKIEGMNVSSGPKVNGIKLEIDDRTLKKQMRMIKNRESACLSRKKKKDYVTSLEARISDLLKENQQLKSVSLVTAVSTKYSTISIFILFFYDVALLQENSVLKDRLSIFANRACDLCGGLSANKSKLGPLSAISNVPKKNAAFLLAFVFMVSLHVGPYLSNQMPSLSTPESSISLAEHSLGSRRLLWIDDATNDSNASSTSDDGRMDGRAYPMCPVSVNQTESIRLASELQRWIVGDFPEYFNISKTANSKNVKKFDLNEISDYLQSDAGGRAIKSFYEQMRNVGKYIKKTRPTGERDNYPSKRKINANRSGTSVDVQPAKTDGHENRVQVYNADAIKYAEFFDEIRRQADTFYVVSFKGDHLLLPAVAHNKTFRPKMSLMLPAVGNVGNGSYNGNGMFTLMRIDCEVLNTSILHIKESSIPDHLWNRSSSKKSASENSVPIGRADRKESTKAERIIRNLPLDPSIVEKNNDKRLLNNVTAENRRRSNILPMETAAAAVHVKPLKPHRPYFLHETDDTNTEKVLNGA